MDITPVTRTVTDYACTLSQADVQLAKDDLYSFGEKFREQLLALEPKPATTGNGARGRERIGSAGRSPDLVAGRCGRCGVGYTPENRNLGTGICQWCEDELVYPPGELARMRANGDLYGLLAAE